MSEAVVGRVAGLWRYPVKSMAGEGLDAVDVHWHGVAGDRRWAFVREGMERSGFPYLTIRQRSDMAHFRPVLSDPEKPDRSRVQVWTPGGAAFDVRDPALAAELGHGARPIKLDRGLFDTAPLSLITTQSIGTLGALIGSELDPRRFRPNLLIEAAGGGKWPEDEWVGAILRIGGMRMRVDQRDERCVVITVDPATAERDPAVLRALGEEHDACIGVYGAVVSPGAVAVGDPVTRVG